MGYYSSGHSYYKYRNLPPVAAAVNRARDRRNTETRQQTYTRRTNDDLTPQEQAELDKQTQDVIRRLRTFNALPEHIQNEIRKRNQAHTPQTKPLDNLDDLAEEIYNEHKQNNHTIAQHLPELATLIRNPKTRNNIIGKNNPTVSLQCQYRHTPWATKLKDIIQTHIKKTTPQPTKPTTRLPRLSTNTYP